MFGPGPMASADDEVTRAAAAATKGYVVAAAGCGKTEQIARATKISSGRRLILTHTNAGADALKARLDKLDVPKQQYRVDTIAGWSLRLSQAFPVRSSLGEIDRSNTDWPAVYSAAETLVEGGAVDRILAASYSGLFVDEYQDCSEKQHAVVRALSEQLPTCVFGDPLQAIFDFEQIVNWERDIFPAFSKVGELKTAHRWRRVNSHVMADWLEAVRLDLEKGSLSFASLQSPVTWSRLPSDQPWRTMAVTNACRTAHENAGEERLLVIADSVNVHARANIAKQVAKFGFSNLEAIDSKPLFSAANRIDKAAGTERLEAAIDFAGACLSGWGPGDLLKGTQSALTGGKAKRKQFGPLIDLAVGVTTANDEASLEALLEAIAALGKATPYCRERFFALLAALKLKREAGLPTLVEAVWEVQNRRRHAGRRLGRRMVGSTLLVKGLECEHVVVVATDDMSARDWYVAITRASKSLCILSSRQSL